jgi:hypothetical protein
MILLIPQTIRNVLKKLLYFLILLFAAGCREEFTPPVKAIKTNYLVVEGFINAAGSTDITLSRTTPLKDSAFLKPEQGATLAIMGEDNTTINLFENTGGHYQSDSLALTLALNKNQKYRLRIQTSEGKEYLSDYIAVKETPPIDSVSWENQKDGVHIYVNTHDPQNKSLYYKWDHVETWEINSHYAAAYKYFPADAAEGTRNRVKPRDFDEAFKMRFCWQILPSANIHIASSVRLASDIISLEPVVFIPRGKEQLSVKYSILVKQSVLDKKGFEFYQLMKKNSESIGSIFDSQPSDISGNIHCTSDPAEKVIGYVMATTLVEKRIFITNQQVMGPEWGYLPFCETVYVVNNPDSLPMYLTGEAYIPYAMKGMEEGYYSVNNSCADCRARGRFGRPDFW